MTDIYYIINKKDRESIFFTSLRKVENYIKNVYPEIEKTISHNTISITQ